MVVGSILKPTNRFVLFSVVRRFGRGELCGLFEILVEPFAYPFNLVPLVRVEFVGFSEIKTPSSLPEFL